MTTQLAVTITDVEPVFKALEKWINQRAGLDWRDYGGDGSAYRSEARSIAADGRRARKALAEARMLLPAMPEVLADSFRAFSGRLEWVPEPCNSDGVTTGLAPAHLKYTTGQYWPTEYRKAAASVLETYIAAWRQAYASTHPRTFVYADMSDVRAANESIGNHWFERSTMKFFNTKIESRLIAGKRFITSDRPGMDHPKRYTIREAQPDGTIDTIGEFQQFGTLAKAKAHVLMNNPKEATA